MELAIQYDVAGGSTQLAIEGPGLSLFQYTKMSFQALGDGTVTDAVTVKVQESNKKGTTFVDIAGASVVVNASTDEYKDVGSFNSSKLQFDINVGSAVAGIIDIFLTFKR